MTSLSSALESRASGLPGDVIRRLGHPKIISCVGLRLSDAYPKPSQTAYSLSAVPRQIVNTFGSVPGTSAFVTSSIILLASP